MRSCHTSSDNRKCLNPHDKRHPLQNCSSRFCAVHMFSKGESKQKTQEAACRRVQVMRMHWQESPALIMQTVPHSIANLQMDWHHTLRRWASQQSASSCRLFTRGLETKTPLGVLNEHLLLNIMVTLLEACHGICCCA